MTNQEAVDRVIEALESLAISYMLVGSLSSNAYGVPRLTQDADFVIELETTDIGRIASNLGEPFRLDPQLTFETVTATHRHEVLFGDSGFKIELFHLSEDAHDQERFRRRVRQEVMGKPVWLPTPEDVVIWKLRWSKDGGRTKDFEDVRSVLAVQGDTLDWPHIHRWCDTHGTRELLEQARASLPKDL